MRDLTEATALMDKAKISLMARKDSAFFTTICFSMKHQWDETIPTAATNGVYIKFNPDFFMSMDPEERVFVLIHESMHVAYMHMLRLDGRDRSKFNVAADHVINLQLIERGFKMPSGNNRGLADPQYAGLSTEEVYDLLPKQDESQTDHDIVPGEGDASGSTTALQRQIEDIIVRASIQSAMQKDAPGTIPGQIQLFLNKLLDPKLPWHRILSKHFRTMAKNDYSFRKLNRRYFPKHYLPGLYSETLMDLVVAVDISGSVSDEEFLVFISEIGGIIRSLKPNKLTLIQFDTAIHSVEELHNMNDLSKVTFTGRGGTDVTPVLEWANEKAPDLLLIFTDGGFHFDGTSTKVNTTWLIHNNPPFTAPFGRVIHYEV